MTDRSKALAIIPLLQGWLGNLSSRRRLHLWAGHLWDFQPFKWPHTHLQVCCASRKRKYFQNLSPEHLCPGPTSWSWRGTTGRTTGTWSPSSPPPTTATAVETRLPSWSLTTPSSIPSCSLTQLQDVGNLMWLVKHQTTSCKRSPEKEPSST